MHQYAPIMDIFSRARAKGGFHVEGAPRCIVG